jgi:hypothetical protein
MLRKEDCLKAIKAFRAKHGLDASDENIVATVHLMNSHSLDVHAALDQSSRASNDNGIDAWQYDDATGELFVYQSKFGESKALVVRGLVDLNRARLWLEKVIIDGAVDSVPSDNNCLFNLYRTVSGCRATLKKLHFILISLFDENEIEDSREFRDLESETMRSRLNSAMQGRNGKIRLEIVAYNLEPCLPRGPKVYPIERIPNARIDLRKSAHLDLAYVTLHSLTELYRKRGDVLFDKNVRLSLMATKEARNRLVNPMTATLERITSGKESPSLFPFYHVGVTVAATASTADIDSILNLEGPSIVNGCQTIVIANEFLKRLEKQNNSDAIGRFKEIRVIAKVVVGTTNDEIRDITNSNNRQNPIENWQLFSNEPIHVEIEAALKESGVFYERQKGKFDTTMKNADNAKYYFGTNGTYIKVVDLGQLVALANELFQWAAKPSEIFLNKENHDKVFLRAIAKYPIDAIFGSNLFKAMKRGLDNYIQKPTYINSNAPLIFRRPIIRVHVYWLALLHFYQADARRSACTDFSTALTKIAHPRLVDEVECFYQKIIARIKSWYTDESKELTVEVSSRKMEDFFRGLALEVGVDREGIVPFSPNTLNWSEIHGD